MAIIYGKNTAVDYAAGNLASFGKSYSRMGAAPLDMTEVWYDKAALEEYAAYRGVEQADGSYDTSSVTSYVGQRVVFVDETANKVYNYSIQLDGSLKEIGTSPVGDNKSIAVAADGTVSLKGIDGLVFEREVDVLDENGEPTGEKKTEEVKYQPLMTKAGLTWVEPSKTTVEGLALLIEALSADVKALETKVGKAAEGEEAATGLFKAVADEAKARDDADKALGERIDELNEAVEAIDFIDETELATALEPYAKTADVNKTLEDYAKTADVVDASTYATDKKALEDEDAAIREIAEEAKSLVDDFLTGTDTDGVVNKLKEIQAELEKLGDVVDLEAALALKADLSYVNEELAKKQNVIAENTYDAYGSAATAEQNAKDYADGLASNYDAAGSAEQALEDAKDYADGLAGNYDAAGAADDVKDYADETFATKAYVGTIPSSYADQKDIIAYVNKKAEETLAAAQGGSSETAASVKLALDNYKTENEPKFEKLEGIEAGAEVNVIETVKVNGTALGVTDKAVNIDLSAYAKQADLDTVSAQANKGVADAAAAQGTANAAAQAASENAAAISGLDTRLGTAEGKINEHTATLATHATEYADLKGRVDGHDTAIAGKAAQADLTALQTTVGEHTTALGTLNTTTIPALQADINSKAANTALTEEINRATAAEQANAAEIAKIPAAIATAKEEAIGEVTKLANGAVAANTAAIENITKAETGAIAVAKAEALQAVNDLAEGQVKANKEAIAILNGEAGATGSVATIADARIAAALAGADTDFDTLKEMSDWLSTHKGSAAEMNTAILANASAIKTINETTIPAAITTANGYTDSAIAALKVAETYETKEDAGKKLQAAKDYTDAQIPAALAAYKVKDVDGVSLQLSDAGVASIKAVSTDLLTQGEFELVLNGGSAN